VGGVGEGVAEDVADVGDDGVEVVGGRVLVGDPGPQEVGELLGGGSVGCRAR
jgi:hypothetical protein